MNVDALEVRGRVEPRSLAERRAVRRAAGHLASFAPWLVVLLLISLPASAAKFKAEAIFHPRIGKLRNDPTQARLTPILRAVDGRNLLTSDELRIVSRASRRDHNLIRETGTGRALTGVWLRLLEVESAASRTQYWWDPSNLEHEVGVVVACSYEDCYDPDAFERRLLALSGAPEGVEIDDGAKVVAEAVLRSKQREVVAQEEFLISLLALGLRPTSAARLSIPQDVIPPAEPELDHSGLLSLPR